MKKHKTHIQRSTRESDQMKKLKRGEELWGENEGSSQFQPSNSIEPRLFSSNLCESEKIKMTQNWIFTIAQIEFFHFKW